MSEKTEVQINALAWGATRQALYAWLDTKLVEICQVTYPANDDVSQAAVHEKLVALESDIFVGLAGLRQHIERGP